MGPYVDSQWGLAQFSLPNESPCVCAFIGDKKSVVGEWMPCYHKFHKLVQFSTALVELDHTDST